MPSKKRKYNARFPAGRIKKIMQTDEEVGKVAQAVPIIISIPRTLELFVESLLSKAMQVTMQRNAKTLSPSHVKQCILAESRFDFLRDLVKNVPDVTAAEEKELQSGESSPNSSRYSDVSMPRRVVREDSNSSSSSDVKIQQIIPPPDTIKREVSIETEKPIDTEAIDLTKRNEVKPVVSANFYQETLVTEEVQHRSVIQVNPTYTSAQPSTSSYASLTPVKIKAEAIVPKPEPLFYVDVRQTATPPTTPITPITPILNIDFTKNLTKPEIKVLDTTIANVVSTKAVKKVQRQNSKPKVRKVEIALPNPVNIDNINSDLQIDEDYDT